MELCLKERKKYRLEYVAMAPRSRVDILCYSFFKYCRLALCRKNSADSTFESARHAAPNSVHLATNTVLRPTPLPCSEDLQYRKQQDQDEHTTTNGCNGLYSSGGLACKALVVMERTCCHATQFKKRVCTQKSISFNHVLVRLPTAALHLYW
jgi:hypothetical protein